MFGGSAAQKAHASRPMRRGVRPINGLSPNDFGPRRTAQSSSNAASVWTVPRRLRWRLRFHERSTTTPCRPSRGGSMLDFAQARRMMVDGQLRTFDVNDLPLLAVVDDLPRERFVPDDRVAFAYIDQDIPVSDGLDVPEPRFMLAPMVLARLVQALDVGT